MRLLCLGLAALACSACGLMPEPDPADWTEYRAAQVAAERPGYPDLADIPEAPTDLRPHEEWDAAIAQMQALADTLELFRAEKEAQSVR